MQDRDHHRCGAAASVPPLAVCSRQTVRASCSPHETNRGWPWSSMRSPPPVADLAVPTDVGDPAAVERLMQRTLDAFGRLDAAFNNTAGGGHGPSPL